MVSAIIREAIDAIPAPDEAARAAAVALQAQLTKPAGALGRLEDLHLWAAGILHDPAPLPPQKTIVIAAADHGVARSGVSAYPQAVTAQMLANFVAGGAAINVLAAHAGARLVVVDAGVMSDSCITQPVRIIKMRNGTDDMTRGPAMLHQEALTLVERGIELAREIAAAGVRLIGLGDMGIGNTTAAAALTSVFTGTPPRMTAGRGTGLDDAGFARKVTAIERALAVNDPDPLDPVAALAAVGGYEIAVLCGVAIGAGSAGCGIVLDGYPTTAAALAAVAMAPALLSCMLASHVSAEPGHRIALGHLGLRPLLDFDMRLGEGTGAALTMSLLDAALRIPREMATFETGGVSRAPSVQRPEA